MLLGKLKALGYATAPPQPAPSRRSAFRHASCDADRSDRSLAIGASTGGIHALGVLFHSLPKRIGVPILVTQHLPAPFMPSLRVSSGRSRIAKAWSPKTAWRSPDRILVAPGDAHLTLEPPSWLVVRLTTVGA